MAYTVKAVSEIAGVSVRTLHHYDEIGLLKPEGHSAAGYRLYTEQDLEKVQQVLFFLERQGRLRRLIQSVDRTLEATNKGKPMNATMFEGFDAAACEEEAR